VVFGFMIATHIVWTMGDETGIPPLLLKAAWAICVGIDLITSWEGTKYYVFAGDESDPAKDFGLAIVTALIVCSTIFLSWLALAKDAKTKSHP